MTVSTEAKKSIPKISIVIPTRNRAEFLKHTIGTCIATRDPDIEIIISDNNSDDDTRAVVASFCDPRIRYFHTGKSLSMRQNYEFALDHVTGEYVIYMGDDDGILKNGLATLRRLLQKHQPDIVNWRHITYLWPSPSPHEQAAVLKFRYRDFMGSYVEKDPRDVLRSFCEAKVTNYRDGANIYHGCVARRLIDKAKKKTGTYFWGMSPDVYTALVNLSVAESFLWIRNPVTIAGAGQKSNGATLSKKSDRTIHEQALSNDFHSLALSDTVKPETDPKIRSVTAMTYSLLDRLNENEYGRDLKINHEAWRRASLDDIKKCPPDLHSENAKLLEDLFASLDKDYTRQPVPPPAYIAEA